MIWKDGGNYGLLCREITNRARNRAICKVWTKQFAEHRDIDGHAVEPWPEGEANFRLILKAPQMLEALESIRDTAACFLQPLPVSVSQARWAAVRDRAIAAIAAVKGEDNDEEDELA